jgi:hypothetical protein
LPKLYPRPPPFPAMPPRKTKKWRSAAHRFAQYALLLHRLWDMLTHAPGELNWAALGTFLDDCRLGSASVGMFLGRTRHAWVQTLADGLSPNDAIKKATMSYRHRATVPWNQQRQAPDPEVSFMRSLPANPGDVDDEVPDDDDHERDSAGGLRKDHEREADMEAMAKLLRAPGVLDSNLRASAQKQIDFAARTRDTLRRLFPVSPVSSRVAAAPADSPSGGDGVAHTGLSEEQLQALVTQLYDRSVDAPPAPPLEEDPLAVLEPDAAGCLLFAAAAVDRLRRRRRWWQRWRVP